MYWGGLNYESDGGMVASGRDSWYDRQLSMLFVIWIAIC